MSVARTRLVSLALLIGSSCHFVWAAPAETPLAANERLQGTLEIDIGSGPIPMRSMATVIDANLGAKTAERLNSAEGRQKLADAKAGMQAKGQSAAGKVTAADIQALADSSAGKTIYSSQAMHLAIIKAYVVTLEGVASDGPRAQLSMRLDEKTLAVQHASFDYVPNGKRRADSFVSPKKSDPVQVKIDKIERRADKGFALSGSFTATNLQPGVISKNLKGQSIPAVTGRFAFQEVALRPN